ncbi:MAG TPA: 6-carboxytetrahydropterin synthase QueD [Sediminispirochaeta sp.]|nr:6-carboxytetrahydropterin synthase QueD [Sediminispirochaeta sp.]
MYVSKEFKFDAAHNLVEYHGKCESLHGHTYRLRVSLKGSPGADGMILDFGILKRIVKEEVLTKLDHGYLNDVVPQSSTENLSLWIWERLEPKLQGENYRLDEIVLWETETSFVTLRADG